MRELTNLMILSAELLTNSEVLNRAATVNLESQIKLANLSYKKVQGKYKGSFETSFVVVTPTASDEEKVYELAAAFGQESVLFINTQRDVELYDFNEDQFTELGKLTAIDATEASKLDSYTFDPISGSYFAIKPAQ